LIFAVTRQLVVLVVGRMRDRIGLCVLFLFFLFFVGLRGLLGQQLFNIGLRLGGGFGGRDWLQVRKRHRSARPRGQVKWMFPLLRKLGEWFIDLLSHPYEWGWLVLARVLSAGLWTPELLPSFAERVRPRVPFW
jgi:hypothetical protein